MKPGPAAKTTFGDQLRIVIRGITVPEDFLSLKQTPLVMLSTSMTISAALHNLCRFR